MVCVVGAFDKSNAVSVLLVVYNLIMFPSQKAVFSPVGPPIFVGQVVGSSYSVPAGVQLCSPPGESVRFSDGFFGACYIQC